jgi:putative chitinase
MAGMDIEGAIAAITNVHKANRPLSRGSLAAIQGFHEVKEWLDEHEAFKTPERPANMMGQCAHESMYFKALEEGMSYSSAKRIQRVFGKGRFPNLADTEQYVRHPKLLANKAYGGNWGLKNLGNTRYGDGYYFRGRGYIHLTGRRNYTRFSKILGIDLVGNPKLAKLPAIAWKIAAAFFSTNRRGGKTAFEWADEGNIRMVTRVINGGSLGLKERELYTNRALSVLERTMT